MDFFTNHFRCEIAFEGIDSNIDLDTKPLLQTKVMWLVEGKLLLLEFQEEALPDTFQTLWEKLEGQCERILSATMYDWDALDQHPGVRTIFKRST